MKSNARNGFTLIEVLIVLLVLGIGFAAIGKFQGSTIKNSSMSSQRAEATNLAQSRLEEVRDFSTQLNTANLNGSGNVTGKTATFYWTRSVTPHANLPNSYNVNVVVTWPDIATGNGAVTIDSTVGLASIVNGMSPNVAVMSDSLPPPTALSDDPTIDLVVCDCTSGGTGGFSRMSNRLLQSKGFFIKAGMHRSWTAPQQNSICTSCCSLPAANTGSFMGGGGGGHMGASSTYLCSVRQGTGHMRWQW